MIVGLLALLGCRPPTCSTSGDCGFGETCDAGACMARTCATSDQCGIEARCSDEGRCVDGCADDTDCRAGRSCGADGRCMADGCVDTHLDCRFREECVDGVCVDAGPPHCLPCTADEQCGEGNLCWADTWCTVDCSDGSGCPAGFTCQDVDDDGVAHTVCVTSCWLF